MMESDFSYAESYRQYLNLACPNLEPDKSAQIDIILANTNWDDPANALDFNNLAVVALTMAEQGQDSSLRGIYLEMALEALTEQASAHPLCAAHLAVLHNLIGEADLAAQNAFSTFLSSLQTAFTIPETLPAGLVYLPPRLGFGAIARAEKLQHLLEISDSYSQALLLFSENLCQSQLAFYSLIGQRFLELATHLAPENVAFNLQLGLANLMQNRGEGLLHLQKAHRLSPGCSPTIQALYLAYRTLQHWESAVFWLQQAQTYQQQKPQALEWQWATLEVQSPFTYLPFDEGILLAVEPSIRSIVTIVLLAEGDWFEAEMEFWRSQLQPGMTVIDVGANAGVYTFSAAQRVGKEGRVLAVEPFSGCVQYLEETCRLNQLTQVKVCAGAASDRNGTAYLSLHEASELNEIVEKAPEQLGNIEEVACFTLDHLIEQEGVDRVDFLKIDAEGHELSVLQGSNRILTEFMPVILYENIAGQQDSNLPVAEFLTAKGYQLFRYQPYLQALIPIQSLSEMQSNLNIIAVYSQP